MNKNTTCTLAAIALSASFLNVSAQPMKSNNSWFFGVGANTSTNFLNQDEISGVRTTAHSADVGFNLLVGKQISDRFSLSFEYSNIGQYTKSDIFQSAGAPSIWSSTEKRYLASIIGTYTKPLDTHFSVFANAGVSYVHTKANSIFNDDTVTSTDQNLQPQFGAGLGYRLANFGADLSYTYNLGASNALFSVHGTSFDYLSLNLKWYV